MKHKAISPEDVLSDTESFVQYKDGGARKGSFAAIIANADILASADATSAEKDAALAMISSIMPSILLSGAAKHLTWNNPQIQNIVDELTHNKN